MTQGDEIIKLVAYCLTSDNELDNVEWLTFLKREAQKEEFNVNACDHETMDNVVCLVCEKFNERRNDLMEAIEETESTIKTINNIQGTCRIARVCVRKHRERLSSERAVSSTPLTKNGRRHFWKRQFPRKKSQQLPNTIPKSCHLKKLFL